MFNYKKKLNSFLIMALAITAFLSTSANANLLVSTDESVIISEQEIQAEFGPPELYYNVYNSNQDSIWFFAVSTNTRSGIPFSTRNGWTNTGLLTANQWTDTLTSINNNLGTNLGGSFSSYFGSDSFATLFYIDSAMDIMVNPISAYEGMSEWEFGLHYAYFASQFVAFNVSGNFIAQSLPVPEPSTLAIFGLALIGLFSKKLKNNKIS